MDRADYYWLVIGVSCLAMAFMVSMAIRQLCTARVLPADFEQIVPES